MYLVENGLKNAKVKLFQSCFLEQILSAAQQSSLNRKTQQLLQNLVFCVPAQKQQQFGLEEPDGEKEVVVEVKFQKSANEDSDEYKMKNIVVNLNDVDVEREYLVASQIDPEKVIRFYVCLRYEQNVKKIQFYEREGLIQRMQLEDKINLQLNVNFDKLTVSLITDSVVSNTSNSSGVVSNSNSSSLQQRNGPARFELALITVFGFDIVVLETLATRTFHAKVQHLCVDNNQGYNSHFPVCLTPKNEFKRDSHQQQVCSPGMGEKEGRGGRRGRMTIKIINCYN